ncbi:uncharacterized protein EHS24_002150 [Apiotrichum porosum]|uniref:Uncharacterized protein n=1 Tax=Apiotrichum porosum TaxID=105984 RepID=A0A427XHS0_9TREE|nr:uncharacterized protein EHS24_002150 [Apiotrichum porosum]RSH78425.1 hypothetical protein EHS24_002150 [Apiotrichum porosum]
MASKVVLVLGNTTTAGYVAELAANNASPGTVTLAIPGTPVIDQVTTVETDLSHDAIAAAFQSQFAKHGRLDSVLCAYTPPADGVKGTPGHDQTAIQWTLDPTIRALKNVLFHARRQGVKNVAVLVINGPDVLNSTAAGAIVGTWRSIQPRLEVLGCTSQLVFADADTPLAAETVAKCVSVTASHVYIVENGSVKTVSATCGEPKGFQYDRMMERNAGGLVKAENVQKFLIWLKQTRSKGLVAALLIVGGVTVKTFWATIVGVLQKVGK